MGKHSKNAPRAQPEASTGAYPYLPETAGYYSSEAPQEYRLPNSLPYDPPPQRIRTPLLADTAPNPVVRTGHKRKRSLLRRIVIIVVIIVVLFIVLGVIGNLLPQKNNGGKSAPSPARTVPVASILRNNSPNWHVTAHIVAVVRPDDGGKSVTLVNSGKGWASGIVYFPQLGISAESVSVWNVWDGTVSPPTVHALRVVLAPGTAEYLILR